MNKISYSDYTYNDIYENIVDYLYFTDDDKKKANLLFNYVTSNTNIFLDKDINKIMKEYIIGSKLVSKYDKDLHNRYSGFIINILNKIYAEYKSLHNKINKIETNYPNLNKKFDLNKYYKNIPNKDKIELKFKIQLENLFKSPDKLIEKDNYINIRLLKYLNESKDLESTQILYNYIDTILFKIKYKNIITNIYKNEVYKQKIDNIVFTNNDYNNFITVVSNKNINKDYFNNYDKQLFKKIIQLIDNTNINNKQSTINYINMIKEKIDYKKTGSFESISKNIIMFIIISIIILLLLLLIFLTIYMIYKIIKNSKCIGYFTNICSFSNYKNKIE